MKYNELKEQIANGVKIDEVIKCKYLSLISQQIIINNIKNICLIENINGLTMVDYTLKNLFELLYALVNCTDIEFPDNLFDEKNDIDLTIAFEVYDFFKENKLVEIIYEQYECREFISSLEKEIEQQINVENSISSVLAKTLNTITSKLPTETSMKSLISELPTLLNSFAQTKKRTSKNTKTQV